MTSYRHNHYVPVWYQRRFMLPGQSRYFRLDLRPETVTSGRHKWTRRDIHEWSPDKIFAEDDLYTTMWGSISNTEIERFFFGEVDAHGAKFLDYFTNFEHPSADGRSFQNFVTYMSVQKLRTPKGLKYVAQVELFAPKMIWRHEIPKATNRLPVEISCTLPNGSFASAKFDYQNDSHGPFGINYGGSARFLSLESEHHGEVDANNLERPSFLKKFLAIRYIVQNELYQSEWGLPHLLSLFVCTDQHEIERRKAIIMRETKGKGASYVMFQVVPAVDESMESVKPMRELYEGPWQRAGHPDFYLNQP